MTLNSKRPTIKEVANAAGVSTQTVSRVINARPDVSPHTRSRVQKFIDELGYQPSALARSLIQQRSYTIGVVTAGLKFIGPSRTLSGITSAAEEAGYALLLKELPYFNANNITPLLNALLSRHVDGIIWAAPEVGDNRDWVNNFSLELMIPLVFITMEPRENTTVVAIDNYLGAHMAVSHLFDQGYQRIGHIAGPMDWWESQKRFAAWEDVLKSTGEKISDHTWVEGNWSSASGVQAAQKLFDKYPDMDAIFAGNDQMALGVLQVARQKGLRVSEDFGVAGFDDIPESGFFCPPLTTIKQDQQEVGRLAVEEIIRIIEADKRGELSESRTIMLTPKLVLRESTLHSKEVNRS